MGVRPAVARPTRLPNQNGLVKTTPHKHLTTELRGGSQLPVTKWSVPAGICAFCYASYNIFIKKASNSIDPLLGGVLLQSVATILGGVLWVTKRGSKISRAGVGWSVLAGIAVGLAEILSFYVNSLGVSASQSIPVIIGGSVLIGCVLGAVFLREILGLRGWCGVLLIATGILLVGMDPGASLH